MTRRLNRVLALLLVVVGLPGWWLLVDNRPGGARAMPVTMAALRQLAATAPGPRPSGIEMELVGWRSVPSALMAAGTGLRMQRIGIAAWRLPVDGTKAIVVDTGMTARQAEDLGLSHYDASSQRRVAQALHDAGLILVTHEHSDHLGGLSADGLGPPQTALLNAPQRRTLAGWTGRRSDDSSDPLRTAPFAAAPGVVVIPAPSHTPGSQMIYVQLADGREVLFTGDIATLEKSWRAIRARSRLVGDYLAPEDRGAVFAWLLTIRNLKAQAPHLIVIPGHDLNTIDALAAQNTIRRGFIRAGTYQAVK